MFGVLVVETKEGGDDAGGATSRYGFLAAYSGLLAGRNDWDYFVPPVYDAQQPEGYFKQQEHVISLTSHLSPLTSKKMSQDLQLWLFHQYQLLNAVAARRHGRLLCAETLAVGLSPRAETRLHGRVLVGIHDEDRAAPAPELLSGLPWQV